MRVWRLRLVRAISAIISWVGSYVPILQYWKGNQNTCAASWQNKQSDCAPSEDSDQLGHPPSLIRVFAVRMKKPWVLNYPMSAQWRLWSDWADAQADRSLRWVHSHFVGFVMRRLTCFLPPYFALLPHLRLPLVQYFYIHPTEWLEKNKIAKGGGVLNLPTHGFSSNFACIVPWT